MAVTEEQFRRYKEQVEAVVNKLNQNIDDLKKRIEKLEQDKK